MKRLIIGGVAAVLLVIAMDSLLARLQVLSLQKEVRNDDFLAAIDAQILDGMHRSEVENRLIGYRETKELKDQGRLIVEYNYWFGFLPPVGILRLFKIAGGIIVTHSLDEKVIDSQFWYN